MYGHPNVHRIGCNMPGTFAGVYSTTSQSFIGRTGMYKGQKQTYICFRIDRLAKKKKFLQYKTLRELNINRRTLKGILQFNIH